MVSKNHPQSVALVAGQTGRLRRIDLQVLQLGGDSDLTLTIASGGAGKGNGFQTHGTFTIARGLVPTGAQAYAGSLVSVDVSSLAFDVTPTKVFSIMLGTTKEEDGKNGFGWVYGESAADGSEFNFVNYESGFNQMSDNGGETFTVTPYDPGFRTSVDISAVPEPGSWAMLIAGFGMAGAAMRRRRLAAG